MGEEQDAVPTKPLADIAFLARSANRVRLLDTLSAEPYRRSTLTEVTDTPSTTIGRILNEFEEKGWVERASDGTYRATARGALVIDEFIPLVEAMETIQSLGEAADWLPSDELTIGTRHFSDATVLRSPPHAPLKTVEYLADLVRDASTFRVLTFLAPPSPVGNAMQEGTVNGELKMDLVLAGNLAEFLRDEHDQPPDWQEIVEAGARVYRYGGQIPCHLFIVDDKVLIMATEPEGQRAVIDSDNDTVLTSVNELLDDYREESEQVDEQFFTVP